MFSLTHKLIAKEVFKSLKSELNVIMDQSWLLSGSIIPDVHPLLMFIPHTKEKSSGIIQENMEWLVKRGISYDSQKEIRKFSYKLGIITHFVSDYFCAAHNEQKYDNLILHFLYERRLKEYCPKYMEGLEPLRDVLRIKDWHLNGDIMEFIHEKHAEYNNLKRSMQSDIAYSIGVSTAVALNIVYLGIKNENNTHISTSKLVQKSA